MAGRFVVSMPGQRGRRSCARARARSSGRPPANGSRLSRACRWCGQPAGAVTMRRPCVMRMAHRAIRLGSGPAGPRHAAVPCEKSISPAVAIRGRERRRVGGGCCLRRRGAGSRWRSVGVDGTASSKRRSRDMGLAHWPVASGAARCPRRAQRVSIAEFSQIENCYCMVLLRLLSSGNIREYARVGVLPAEKDEAGKPGRAP